MVNRQALNYGFLFLIGVILIVAGIQGQFGTVLGAVLVPDVLKVQGQ